jgi:phytoene dehydrogenase-like protein
MRSLLFLLFFPLQQGAAAAALAREALAVAEVREVLLERLSAACGFDVAAHVVAERVVPPSQWASAFGLRQGAVFGLAHPLSQVMTTMKTLWSWQTIRCQSVTTDVRF